MVVIRRQKKGEDSGSSSNDTEGQYSGLLLFWSNEARTSLMRRGACIFAKSWLPEEPKLRDPELKAFVREITVV